VRHLHISLDEEAVVLGIEDGCLGVVLRYASIPVRRT